MPVKSSARKKLSRANQRDLDIKIEFLEGLVRRDPAYVDALQLLGDHYTQRGRYLDGLKVDERLARLEPRNAARLLQSRLQLHPDQPVRSRRLRLGKGAQPRLPRFQLAGQRPRPPQTPPAAGLPRYSGQNPPDENQSLLEGDRMNVTVRGRTRHYRTVTFDPARNEVLLIEQRLLPHEFKIVATKNFRETAAPSAT